MYLLPISCTQPLGCGLDFWGRIDDGLNLGQDCMYSVCGVDLQVLVIARCILLSIGWYGVIAVSIT